MSTNEKRFIVLNKDEILAEEVKTFPSLHDKISRSYQDRGVIIRAWVEVDEKLEFWEDGMCC